MSQPTPTNRLKQSRAIRDGIAVVLLIAAITQLLPMFNSETFVNPWVYDPETQFDTIRTGFQHYCYAFGLILFLAGTAFLLLTYNDKIDTNPSRLVPEDED